MLLMQLSGDMITSDDKGLSFVVYSSVNTPFEQYGQTGRWDIYLPAAMTAAMAQQQQKTTGSVGCAFDEFASEPLVKGSIEPYRAIDNPCSSDLLEQIEL